jgi:serine/threonine protein kinase
MEAAKVIKGFEPPERASEPLIAERYIQVCRLAAGGTSQIWLAHDTYLDNKPVVLKQVNSELTQRKATRNIAVREAAIGQQLSHSNLIKIFDYVRSSEAEYVVMEYLDGVSLNSQLSRQVFSYNTAIDICDALVSPLMYLHQKGVVHSDLKPSNIVITRDNTIKLIDLANCRADTQAPKQIQAVQEHTFFGFTQEYSSPQVINDQPANTSDDTYSLACILLEMLGGNNRQANGAKSIDGRAKRPKGINYLQWLILRRALSPKASERFSSAAKFMAIFKEAANKNIARWLLAAASVCALGFFSVIWLANTDGNLQSTVERNAATATSQEPVEQVISRIISLPADQRVQSLTSLSLEPTIRRQAILANLRASIVPEQVDKLERQLLRQYPSPDYKSLLESTQYLLRFYPDSAALHDFHQRLSDEQAAAQAAARSKLAEFISQPTFTKESAERLTTAVLALKQVQDPVWQEQLSSSQLRDQISNNWSSAIEAMQWREANQLLEFVSATQPSISLFAAALGPFDEKIHDAIRLMAQYLSTTEAGGPSGEFPTNAATYLLSEQLQTLSDRIDDAWLNRDLVSITKELEQLRDRNLIPGEFPAYRDVAAKLKAKVATKIQYHLGRDEDGYATGMKNMIDQFEEANAR